MVYSFEVKENSTLLGCQYAAFLDDCPSEIMYRQHDLHFGNEHPSAFLSITLMDAKGNNIHPSCGLFDHNANNDPSQYTFMNHACSNTGGVCVYKDWTNYVYDLREHIGEIVTIEVWVHDCLLDLPVCDNCKTVHPNNDYFVDEDGIPRISECNNANWGYRGVGCKTKNARCRMVPMAGGHKAYCYFTAFTKKMEMVMEISRMN